MIKGKKEESISFADLEEKPFIKRVRPKRVKNNPMILSEVALDNSMCQGEKERRKEEASATYLFLVNWRQKKYIAKMVSAPKKAEGNLTANSFTPKMNVEAPDR